MITKRILIFVDIWRPFSSVRVVFFITSIVVRFGCVQTTLHSKTRITDVGKKAAKLIILCKCNFFALGSHQRTWYIRVVDPTEYLIYTYSVVRVAQPGASVERLLAGRRQSHHGSRQLYLGAGPTQPHAPATAPRVVHHCHWRALFYLYLRL